MAQIGSEERPVMFRKAIVSKESRYRKGFNKKKFESIAYYEPFYLKEFVSSN